jgi:hypothetical protein
MSDASSFDFGKFIPGFDFLQQLASAGKSASGPVPGLGGWVAPTVSVDELDKRIQELKTVLFWLDQNATALKATIQALEVQKMTLAALAGMNLSMAEVAKAFTLPATETPATATPSDTGAAHGWPFGAATAPAEPAPPAAEPEPAAAAESPPEPAPEPEPAPTAKPARKRTAAQSSAKAGAPAAAGLADPMQWWGALTQQFQQIAAKALHEAGRIVPPQAGASAGDGDATAAPAGDPAAGSGAASKAVTPASKPAARKPAAKKTVARKSAAKKATASKTAKKTTRKTTKSPAKQPAAGSKADARTLAGWPLPPPFKFGR